MLTKPIAVVGLAAGVIVAAGTGAYLAVRQNSAVRPPPQIEVDSLGALGGLTSTEAAGPDGAVDATEAVVGNLDSTPAEEVRIPAPEREPRERPVATPATAPTTRTAPAERESAAPPPEPAPAVSEPAPLRVAEAVPEPSPVAPAVREPATPAPDDATPARTARADLPVVDGWARPETPDASFETTPEPVETAPTSADIGSVDSPDDVQPVEFVELEIAADSVIGLQVDTAVSTRTAEVEDTVEARVTRDVLVADQVAVSAGTRMLGSVVLVERGGKIRDAARLGVRFHTLVMEDGIHVPIVTETIYREGRSRGSDSVAKIGGAAVGGAILGAIFGGGRGAAIGGSIGAAGGTAAALNGEAEPAGLLPGTRLTVRLSRPVAITILP